MADVFISYKTEDIQRAKSVRRLLEQNGISCWMGDADIHASNSYTKDITAAIKQCRVFLLMLSSAAQESTYVRSELECAVSGKKRILTVLIENFKINDDFLFHVRANQAIKAYEDWKEAEIKLLNTLLHLCTENRENKPASPMTQSSEEMRKTGNADQKYAVCCPFCGCTYVKQKRFFLDRYLYPDDGNRKNDTLLNWVVKNRVSLESFIGLLSMTTAIALIIVLFSESGKNPVAMVLLGAMLVLHILITMVSLKMQDVPDLIGNLLGSIQNSKLKYWTFHCARCEKNFSILLPRDAELKNMVQNLIEDGSEEDSEE